jgi:hypothetical protein
MIILKLPLNYGMSEFRLNSSASRVIKLVAIVETVTDIRSQKKKIAWKKSIIEPYLCMRFRGQIKQFPTFNVESSGRNVYLHKLLYLTTEEGITVM